MATLTAVQPSGRFGAVMVEKGQVRAFREKPQGDGGWINGGFFVLSPKVIDHIKGDDEIWEKYPLESLVQQDQLSAYVHGGFWHAMDTMRDKEYLEKLWLSGEAPWKVWANHSINLQARVNLQFEYT